MSGRVFSSSSSFPSSSSFQAVTPQAGLSSVRSHAPISPTTAVGLPDAIPYLLKKARSTVYLESSTPYSVLLDERVAESREGV